MELGEDTVNAWLEAEPGRGTRLGAVLEFLHTMTLAPDALGPADVQAVRSAGVSDEALEDAIHVALMFNVINRVADGLGFAIPEDAAFPAMARALLRFGYEL